MGNEERAKHAVTLADALIEALRSARDGLVQSLDQGDESKRAAVLASFAHDIARIERLSDHWNRNGELTQEEWTRTAVAMLLNDAAEGLGGEDVPANERKRRIEDAATKIGIAVRGDVMRLHAVQPEAWRAALADWPAKAPRPAKATTSREARRQKLITTLLQSDATAKKNP